MVTCGSLTKFVACAIQISSPEPQTNATNKNGEQRIVFAAYPSAPTARNMVITTQLPTTTNLGIPKTEIQGVNTTDVASAWLVTFSEAVSQNDIDRTLATLTDDAWWRDLLAMTWDLRSFQGPAKIKQFLSDRLALSRLSNFKLTSATVDDLYDDLAWVRAHFTFDCAVGQGSGVARIVPVKSAGGKREWKAHNVLTNLESLAGFPESTGWQRNFQPNHGKWISQRQQETEFVDKDPDVLIVGGGQSGLEVAARLKLLGVPTLVCEKQARVGDQWRHRYAALCLHDVVWYDHMPYMPFPPSWPVYTPAQKLADWLENYAKSMEIDVWTSAKVIDAKQGPDGKWSVTVQRGDKNRVLKVNHVIFALGVGGGTPKMPNIPGMDKFKGQILHSTQHGKASDHAGKKVVVVGACTSAHDIAADYYEHGVDVTLWQRSKTYIMTTKEGMPRLMKGTYWQDGPPTEVADLIDNSMPILYRKMIHVRIAEEIAEADKELLKGLEKVGFNLTKGIDNSGFLILALMRLGGYYLDVGASQMIIDGKIKLKSGSGGVKEFTEDGLIAEDGSKVKADVVLFATGYGDSRDPIREIVGEEVGQKLTPVWGLDDEGELRSTWKEIGVPNLWLMMGNFAWCRFYSKHLALQIKAKQEGVFGERYSAPVKWD
ncbi:FAD/NAD-P-binding domain-containing protein [Trametopsis cervina]|nr:FAD/NAD-P-binding domain-containing protein [Trametopsis cervina]